VNIPVVRKVLEKNAAAAAENRARFDRLGLTVVNVLGGAGAGKTALLEAVLPALRTRLRVGVLEGDLETTRDAERIAALDVPVVQLLTEGGCHLTAAHVQRALPQLRLGALDLLIIENVGNPICPANFNLGEHARVAVLSVAEGHDKPQKYPLLFRDAQLVVFSKCDLLPLCDFDAFQARDALRQLNPEARVVNASIRTREGVDRLEHWFVELAAARHVHPVALG
jgi:hydrogenase nickel incorporation protein HypB